MVLLVLRQHAWWRFVQRRSSPVEAVVRYATVVEGLFCDAGNPAIQTGFDAPALKFEALWRV
jgi:hypothetical protein